MTTTEQATIPMVWTKNRITHNLKLHVYGKSSQLSVDAAVDVCERIVADYEKRIEAVEMAASKAINDMVADLMALRAEVATLRAANDAAKQFQPLPRRLPVGR